MKIRKIMIAFLSVMLLMAAGCQNKGNQGKTDKQSYYATYFDTHELINKPVLISNYDETFGTTMEMGINGDLFYMMIGYEENSLTMYGNNNKAWLRTVISGEDDGWVVADIESSEDVQLFSETDLVDILDGDKEVTYKETLRENGKEYDVLSVSIKAEEEGGDPIPAEVWVHDDKVEKITYDSPTIDENGNDIVARITILIKDGSSLKRPAETDKAEVVAEDDLLWQILAFVFSNIDLDDVDLGD
ncbi:MAG: hypothetical protein IJM79_08830 [Erysipelotrichaceae bacterium]|nr:hypothetical protein [Erysipelotrichaceae bacterium]